MAPGLVGFLHFFTLGAALPLLPLYLTKTLGYSWMLTGVILTAVPFSLLIAQLFVRSLSHVGFDVRLGLALSHLLAAGIIMGPGIWLPTPMQDTLQPPTQNIADWRIVFALTVLYFALLAPSMTWIAHVGDAATVTGKSVIRSWRVWGAVGFIAPAWLCESVLVRFPGILSRVESHDILFLVASWSGLATAFAAMLLPEIDPETEPPGMTNRATGGGAQNGLGIRLTAAFLLVVIVQRCHYAWNATFFESVFQQYDIGRPFVHRLTVADQVFELLGLFLLGTSVVTLGPRLMLAGATLAWVARSALLGWMSQSGVSGQVAMSCLLVAQVLQGCAVVAFFGTIGALLRLHGSVTGGRRQIIMASLAGILGMLIAGGVATFMLSPPAWDEALHPLVVDLVLIAPVVRGWPGTWWLSTVPALLAFFLVVVARVPKLSFDEIPQAGNKT
ncbi:MAG: hypothetical protein O3B13_22815 [Planctomycetota bacterium]|nr:hypothetical protein [Planctomycetota bacterium]MDA1165939.1 hypothetical protein [Planctomycetota bacterium]